MQSTKHYLSMLDQVSQSKQTTALSDSQHAPRLTLSLTTRMIFYQLQITLLNLPKTLINQLIPI